jgi:hypothetical protein
MNRPRHPNTVIASPQGVAIQNCRRLRGLPRRYWIASLRSR